jgi:zinc/manganese transport system substrate-binding protein
MPCRDVTLALLAIFVAWPAHADGKLKAVASISIIGDFVKNVGVDRVEVATLVGPNSNTHMFSPTPADARRLGAAKVAFVNGMGLEGWMTRLVAVSGSHIAPVVVTAGVKLRQAEGGGHEVIDPHAWQSVANAKIYAANIRDVLKKADPAGAAVYDANAQAYLEKLDALEHEVRETVEKIPPDRRKIITTHGAFGYFGEAYGVEFIAATGVSSDSEPSARDVARIITEMKRRNIPAVFMENISDPRMMQQIARETGARIGGTLYSDALSDASGPAATYIDMMRSNVRELARALMP